MFNNVKSFLFDMSSSKLERLPFLGFCIDICKFTLPVGDHPVVFSVLSWLCTGSYFVLSMFDKLWHKDLTEAEALELMEKGIAEVKSRLVVAPPSYCIKIVDKDGIRVVKNYD